MPKSSELHSMAKKQLAQTVGGTVSVTKLLCVRIHHLGKSICWKQMFHDVNSPCLLQLLHIAMEKVSIYGWYNDISIFTSLKKNDFPYQTVSSRGELPSSTAKLVVSVQVTLRCMRLGDSSRVPRWHKRLPWGCHGEHCARCRGVQHGDSVVTVKAMEMSLGKRVVS